MKKKIDKTEIVHFTNQADQDKFCKKYFDKGMERFDFEGLVSIVPYDIFINGDSGEPARLTIMAKNQNEAIKKVVNKALPQIEMKDMLVNKIIHFNGKGQGEITVFDGMNAFCGGMPVQMIQTNKKQRKPVQSFLAPHFITGAGGLRQS